MDLLDFEAKDLYFEQEDTQEVQDLIKFAADLYNSGEAELPLLKAYLRAPESLNVLVALNRFYYYQHRLPEALLISEKALALIGADIAFPEDWRQLEMRHISEAPEGFAHTYQVIFVYIEIGGLFEHASGESGFKPQHFRDTGGPGRQG